jgi:hypothetical protein
VPLKPPLKSKPARVPKRKKPVTLCIAAACRDNGKDRIVIGTDWRIESEISAGADIQDKLYWINDDIPILVSGNVTRSIELRDAYRTIRSGMRAQNPPEELDHKNIRRFIKAGARLFKRELTDEVATFALGLSYKEMREAIARKEIPPAVSIPVYRKIEQVDFECDVIVIPFVDDEWWMFQVERTGNFQECDSFAVVGEGAYVAQANLFLRGHDDDDSLEKTLYHVYEAMDWAARCVGSVSKNKHTINVLYPPGRLEPKVTADYLTESGFDFFRDLQKDFGIRSVRRIPALPSRSLRRGF